MAEYDTSSAEKIPSKKILSVSDLNALARQVLEQHFSLFWVSGEISNFTRAASGHWYFSLKDASAQVRCVMFRGRNNYVDFTPREGDNIEARAKVGLYEARGEFQLTIEFIQKAGLGALFEAFEKLKAKLAHEGLFDPQFKQAIPDHAKTIGIVTSADAAALRDIMATLKRRNPRVKLVIYPTPVQGKAAAPLIAQAIHNANTRQEVDTLLICRGGGSIEDLWPFNEEVVARAIDECTIPTISGVGHETDFTICDFVADLRAATPTAAAELACIDIASLQHKATLLSQRLDKSMQDTLNNQSQRLDYLSRRLISPRQQLSNQQQQVQQIQRRLQFSMQQQIQQQQQRLLRLDSNLSQLNPDNVLARGYALVQNAANEVITDSHQLQAGDHVHIKLQQGSTSATIKQTQHPSD